MPGEWKFSSQVSFGAFEVLFPNKPEVFKMEKADNQVNSDKWESTQVTSNLITPRYSLLAMHIPPVSLGTCGSW